MQLMYDAVNIDNIPGSATAVAGYINGSFPNFNSLNERFPHAHHVSIAVNVGGVAEFLDVEHGDALISQASGWLHEMLARGVDRPGIYAQASYWQSGGLYRDLEGYGNKIRRWIADWTFHEHLPNGFDACQWAGGMVLDVNVVSDTFFGAAKPVPVLDPYHYGWFMGTYAPPANHKNWGKVNEELTVRQYDGARAHPIKYRLYLKNVLELKLRYLADRVAYEAIKADPHKNGKPSWDKFNRGWRYQALIHRAEGKAIKP